MAATDDARCRQLARPEPVNLTVSCLIVLGLLISYLPQHHRLISRRSSEGLSPYFVLLGTTSGTCAIANILMLPASREDLGCCQVNSAFSCAAGLLGVLQVGVQWSCFFLMSVASLLIGASRMRSSPADCATSAFLFLIFIPRPGISRQPVAYPLQPSWQEAVSVVVIAMIHFLATFIVSIVVFARFPHHLQAWANILGLLCITLASIQYIPQIYMTWKLQHVGSLSVPMMFIQTPGGYLFAASLAARFGAKGWSTWLVYIVNATLQGCLLVMAVSFILRDRRAASRKLAQRESTAHLPVARSASPTSDEETPLINGDEDARGPAPNISHAQNTRLERR